MITYDDLLIAWRKAIDSIDLDQRYRRCLRSADLKIISGRHIFFAVNNQKKRSWIKENLIEILQDKLRASLNDPEINLAVLSYEEMEIICEFEKAGDKVPAPRKVFYDKDKHPIQPCWFCDKPSTTTVLVSLKLDDRDYLRMVHKYGSSQVQIPTCSECKHHWTPEIAPKTKAWEIIVPVVCIVVGEAIFFLFNLGIKTLLGKIIFGFCASVGIMVVVFRVIEIISSWRHPEEAKQHNQFMKRAEEYPEVKRLLNKRYYITDIS